MKSWRICSLLVECGRHKTVSFLFVHFGYIPRGYPRAAVRAENRAVVLRKVNRTFDNSVVIHFYKIAFTDFLVSGNETFAVRTAYFKNMAAFDFSAIRIFMYLHIAVCTITAFALSIDYVYK